MVHAAILSPSKVKPLERIRLRQLLSRGTRLTPEQMHDKFMKLDSVILLKEKSRIRGVATIKKFRFSLHGKNAIGILNDEIVADRDVKPLARAFYRYLWMQRFLHPFTPIFWITIDPGDDGISPVLKFMADKGGQVVPISESMTWKPPAGRAYFGMFKFWKALGHQLASFFRRRPAKLAV